MGKKLSREELLFRLYHGDLKTHFQWYLENNYELIDLIHTDAWRLKLRHKDCNTITLRSIDKIKRHQGCSLSLCKVSRQKRTNLLLYGDENYNNLEKMKQTKLAIYGDTFGTRNKIAKTKSTLNQQIISDKMVQTRRNKYGDAYMSDVTGMTHTWRVSMDNNKKNMSKWELEAYNALLSKFKIVKFNYYNELRYPYLCDFYIEDIDTFIELQYHWSHGTEPYTGTPEQEQMIEYWKSRNWLSNIKVYTIKDVNKRTWALRNNLNYLEFFTKDEFTKWIDSL